MRRSRIIPFALFAIAALAVAAQDTVTLRRELKEGSVEKYKMESNMKMSMELPGMGTQDMDMIQGMTYTLKLGKVDAEKGEAEATLITKLDEMKMEGGMAAGAMPDMSSMPPIEAKMVLDRRNRMRLAENAAAGNPMLMLMSGGSSSTTQAGLFVEFPEGVVKVGDSWDIVIPKSPMTSKEDQKLKVTLTGEKDVDGIPTWVVKMEGTIKMEPDLEAMMKASEAQGQPVPPMQMKMTGTMEISGEGVVEKATGQTVRMTTKMKMNNSMEMVDMGMKIDMTGTGTAKVTRVK